MIVDINPRRFFLKKPILYYLQFINNGKNRIVNFVLIVGMKNEKKSLLTSVLKYWGRGDWFGITKKLKISRN